MKPVKAKLLRPKIKQQIVAICKTLPTVKILYFFGSQKRGDAGPNSDYDFAVLFTPGSKKNHASEYLKLLGKLISILKSDYVDLVDLNSCYNLFLKFNVIIEGEVIFERPNYRSSYEIPTKGQYYDFCMIQERASR